MSKLYLFGDSFGVFTNQKDTQLELQKTPEEDNSWWKILQYKLDCKEIVNYCINGSSLDYMQWKFFQHINEITKEDYVIVIHTEASRRWFIEDCPGITNFINFINFPNGDIRWDWIDFVVDDNIPTENRIKLNKQIEIARDYCFYIADAEMEDLYGSSIASYFKEYQTKGYKLINIPAYNVQSVENWNVGFVTTGVLEQTSVREFKPMFDMKGKETWTEVDGQTVKVTDDMLKDEYNHMETFVKITSGIDGRIGHLSKPNHIIMASKLYNSFTKNSNLILDEDFESEFITRDNWEDYNDYGMQVSSFKGKVKDRFGRIPKKG